MSVATLPNGASIWYKKTGRGAPLLQIHGTAFGHRNFEKMTPLMAEHFEVIDFDLPGYGESRSPRVPQDMAETAGLVADLIRVLNYEKVHIHGTSYGAMIGLTLAANTPDLVDKLVLSCFLARYDAAARMMRATWKRTARESGMEAVADLTSVAGFARSFFERPGAQEQLASMRIAFARNTAEAFIKGTEVIERTDLSSFAARVSAKTLLLAGKEDAMTPFSPGASGVGFVQIAPMLAQAQTVVLPDCGHYLVIEQPELATKSIVDFIAQ